MKKVFFAIACALPTYCIQADTVVQSPKAGTGEFNLVPNGSFNSGLGGWSPIPTEPYGTFVWNSSEGFRDDGSMEAVPSVPRSGPGFGFQQQIAGLQSGETYVVSGYFNGDGLGEGLLYIDLTDAIGADTGIRSDLRQQLPQGWFFAYDEFIAPSSTVTLRVIRDNYGNDLSAGGLVDDLAITPLALFIPPVGVPEPASIAMMICILLPASWFRLQRSILSLALVFSFVCVGQVSALAIVSSFDSDVDGWTVGLQRILDWCGRG